MPVIKILLLPIAFLYKLATDFRNHLYDIGNKKSVSFEKFIISVGNLTIGGTGKTPFVELIVRELKQKYRLAILSRGYKRKTHGFRLAGEDDDANSIGDEPFQYYMKYGSEVKVAVGEERALAIPELLFNDGTLEVIILDDAFQHRSVKPQLNILLNDYTRPFYKDFVLPAGRMRESRKHAKRADLIVVTKCPDEITIAEMDKIRSEIYTYADKHISIFFSAIRYLEPKQVFGNENFTENVLLFSGIANPDPLEKYVDQNYNLLGRKRFPDHYSFSSSDLKEIGELFESIHSENKCILTTEKDMVRVISMHEEARYLQAYPVFYLPIELYFLRNGDFFTKELNEKVKKELTKIGLN